MCVVGLGPDSVPDNLDEQLEAMTELLSSPLTGQKTRLMAAEILEKIKKLKTPS